MQGFGFCTEGKEKVYHPLHGGRFAKRAGQQNGSAVALSSSGSSPLGGPVHVTHSRCPGGYFRPIPEGGETRVARPPAWGKGGENLRSLDMGQPASIRTWWRPNLIRLSGFEHDRDIKIRLRGPASGRGKRLFEKRTQARRRKTFKPNRRMRRSGLADWKAGILRTNVEVGRNENFRYSSRLKKNVHGFFPGHQRLVMTDSCRIPGQVLRLISLGAIDPPRFSGCEPPIGPCQPWPSRANNPPKIGLPKNSLWWESNLRNFFVDRRPQLILRVYQRDKCGMGPPCPIEGPMA